METEVKRLAEKVWGKSTLASRAAEALNSLYLNKKGVSDDTFAVNIPMDGYHYTRAQLAAMPDPQTAIYRRGAAFTFDAENFYKLVQKLREPLNAEGKTIFAPSFDHALKDPVADNIKIHQSTHIVFLEGNYLSLDREPWRSAALLMDELWFVTIDREIARQRLAKRHVISGIVPNLEAAHHRIKTTDFLNADDILQNGLKVDEEIRGDV
ncbi:MAG: hypothetical protein M1834_001090 [Cirrosporium novae-zelandiae]|nr:MAG: hypothetical protein M1834_001090 [Cirrosporium novae-zelandiae]